MLDKLPETSLMPNKSFKARLVLPKDDSAAGGWYSRGYFPHFDGEGVIQHVCFHLFDSLPQSLLTQWRVKLRGTHASGVPHGASDEHREWRRRIHDFLDSGYGCCALRDDRLAEIVENALDVPRRSSPKLPHNQQTSDTYCRKAPATRARASCRMSDRERNKERLNVAGRLSLAQKVASAPDRQYPPAPSRTNLARRSL